MKKNTAAQKILYLGMFLVLFSIVIFLWFWKGLPPQLPWFYSLPWGEQQLADKILLLFFLCGSIVLLVITRLIGVWAGKKDENVENTIMMGGLIATLLLCASFFRIMQIMGQL